MNRRSFLRRSLTGSALALAASTGLLANGRVLAAHWVSATYRSSNEADLLKALFGSTTAAPSDAVVLNTPKQGNAEAVAIEVDARLEHVETIALVVDKNPHPFSTAVTINKNARGFYTSRIKIKETSTVTAYVKAGGKLYSASHKVKIIGVGGYGINH